MTSRHYYLELKDGDKLIKRTATSLAAEFQDRQRLEEYKTDSSQHIYFVASSEPERIIN